MLGATLVQKIFYTAIGTFVYLYLFLSVPGTFNLQLGIRRRPSLARAVADRRRASSSSTSLVKKFWSKVEELWEQAKQGGAILANKRDYVIKVLLPSFGSWLAKLAVIGIFLAAYSIPVTFHTIMSVMGGNSLANTLSFTPGGVGVTQAVNSVSLSERDEHDECSCLLARPADHRHRLELRVRAHNSSSGSSGGRAGSSSLGQTNTGAKEKAAEQSAAHKALQGREEGGQALGRRRLIVYLDPWFTAVGLTTPRAALTP